MDKNNHFIPCEQLFEETIGVYGLINEADVVSKEYQNKKIKQAAGQLAITFKDNNIDPTPIYRWLDAYLKFNNLPDKYPDDATKKESTRLYHELTENEDKIFNLLHDKNPEIAKTKTQFINRITRISAMRALRCFEKDNANGKNDEWIKMYREMLKNNN